MKIRYGLLIGVISSLVTVLAIVTLMAGSGAVLAQQGDPPQAAPDENNPGPASPPAGDDNAGGPAWPSEPEGKAPNAVTEYIHVAGSTFVPMHSDSGVDYAPWGCMFMTGPSSSSNFVFALPNGSTITELRMYYVDTSGSYNGTMQFSQYNDGQSGTYLDTLQTTGSAGWGTVTHSGLNFTVNGFDYSYVAYWSVVPAAGNGLQLCGFRVGYTPPIGRVNLLPATLFNGHP